MHLRFLICGLCPHQLGGVFTRLCQRLYHRGRISLVGFLQGHRQHCAGLQIHGMLRFVCQMRPTIFHLGNPCVRIMRIDPIFVAGFVLPRTIEPRQVFPRRRFDPRFLGQPFQKFLVTLAIVSPHDRTHRRIGLQRGCVQPHSLALHQPLISQPFQDPEENLAVRLHIHQPSRP